MANQRRIVSFDWSNLFIQILFIDCLKKGESSKGSGKTSTTIRIRNINGRVEGIKSRSKALEDAGAGGYDWGPANLRIKQVHEENKDSFDFSLSRLKEIIFGKSEEKKRGIEKIPSLIYK